jgi:hypothetical protein
MKSSSRAAFFICAALLAVVASGSSFAQESGVRTFRWDIGDEANPNGIGGWLTGLLVGPLDGEIVKARMIVEFVTADAWDVSGLQIHLQGPVEHIPGTSWTVLEVTGPDLGWDGVGHFRTVYETDDLNGPLAVVNNISLWPFELNEFGDFFFGRYLELRIELDIRDLVADDFCRGDLNVDGMISGTDLRFFEEGPCPTTSDCAADMNRDGWVTREDRTLLIGSLNSLCPVAP